MNHDITQTFAPKNITMYTFHRDLIAFERVGKKTVVTITHPIAVIHELDEVPNTIIPVTTALVVPSRGHVQIEKLAPFSYKVVCRRVTQAQDIVDGQSAEVDYFRRTQRLNQTVLTTQQVIEELDVILEETNHQEEE